MSFKVCKYTKDERWVKSGVKMESLVDEYSIISVSISFGLYGVVFLALLLVAWYRGWS
jgi:hypothetical protein